VGATSVSLRKPNCLSQIISIPEKRAVLPASSKTISPGTKNLCSMTFSSPPRFTLTFNGTYLFKRAAVFTAFVS